MSLKSLVSRVIPAAVGFVTGGPVGAFASTVATEQAKKQEKQIKRQINEENARRQQIMEIFGSGGGSIPTIQSNLARTTPIVSTASSGGGFFDTIRGGLREVGGFTQDLFASGLPSLFGVKRPPSVGQQPAITTVTNVGAQESQGSGSIQAGMGAALPSVLAAGRGLLKSPLGQLALGTGAGVALTGLGSQGSGMRITRKMKSQARMVLNLAQGNISVAADMLNISEDMLVQILLKRFRNDGPVVTKAALRKTKQTIRRLKSMSDMFDSLRPNATRRRTPMKRATTTTLIKN
tara:strand:- start:190 stop:1065 length:876 start_codon:yes stop_codon:yes gene_type:complete